MCLSVNRDVAYSSGRSELCTVVESMFSFAYLYRFHGTNDFADRAELAAFNALPAAVSHDCKDRTLCSILDKLADLSKGGHTNM